MKRLLLIALSLIIVVGLFSGCGEKANTFKVGFDQNFPPYGFVDENGEFTGFDIELATETAKRLGKEVELIPIEWASKDAELDAGTIDCIWNGFTINGREDKYTWTEPYVNNSQVFIVKKSSGITTTADLAGKIVTAQSDSSAEKALKEEANKALLDSFDNLVACGEYNTAFMDLDSGAVDAIAMDVGVARYQISGREDEFLILEEELAPEQYAVGFKLGNTELRDQVQKVLEEMSADGTFAEISEKWFSEDVGIIGK